MTSATIEQSNVYANDYQLAIELADGTTDYIDMFRVNDNWLIEVDEDEPLIAESMESLLSVVAEMYDGADTQDAIRTAKVTVENR